MERSVAAFSFAVCSLAIAFAAGSGPTRAFASDSSAAAPRAEDIYLRAMRAMRAQPQPNYVIFRADYWARNAAVRCTADDGLDISLHHGDSFSAFRVWYRVADGRSVTVDPKTRARCDDGLIEPAGAQVEALGQGTPAPTATASSTGRSSGPPLIGTVRVEAVHFYRVTLAGIETIDGHPAYHLELHAYRNPFDHPLTDLWVDTSSLLIRRLQAEVSVHLLIASARGSFVASFERSGPYWLLDNEHIEFAANATLVHVRSTINVRASEFAFPTDLPGVFPSPKPSASSR